ncbi:universal stress protein [Dactylosporangium sp. CA-139066]|uniref:universal stress protein n=1 Tax=Dactylosporangium sp. CA-139066 TaxID=3239930 RepID=UPI003D8CBB7E
MVYRFGPVVAGVDGSASSLGALRWAADEACRCTRMLRVVTALPSGTADPAGCDIAARAAIEAQRWRVGVAAIAETRRGSPVEVLRELAEDARMVVIGGRGAGAGDGRPVGSVSQALATRAGAPVLIVHDAQRWADPDAALPRTAPVVTGFDGSESSRRALRLAFEESAARCVRLVIVQAWADPDLWQPGAVRGGDLSSHECAVRDALRAAAAPWCAEFPLLEVEVRAEPDDAVHALAVASQWAGLLVVGARCPSDRIQPDDPSVVARPVLQYAACPVLIAHGPSRVPARPATLAA